MRVRMLPALGTIAALGLLLPGLFLAPKPTAAMPPFAQAYNLKCSACHTMVPSLNAYGRYIQYTGYAALDRHTLAKALPVWIDESMNYDSGPNVGAGTNTARFSFGNLALHLIGYALPDVTEHIQQWIVQDDQSGTLDTAWVAYSNLLRREGHFFVGKVLVPAPSFYSQDFEIDGPAASSTVVGEHDWGATYSNRWGPKLAYLPKNLDVEAAWVFSGADLNGITDFNSGEKTFMWKAAYVRPKSPLEFGVFGSFGSLPVSTGLDNYYSFAGYAQLDPDFHWRPGLIGVYQSEFDFNPGLNTDGIPLGATASRGSSLGVYEPFFKGGVMVGFLHNFNDGGAGSDIINGNAINLGFNVPHFNYLHGYLEALVGGQSELAGVTGGPTWKAKLWLTLPISNVR
jgi:hypothetical protein